MRISSNTIYDSNVALMGQQQTRLMQTQQQIASGKRLLTAGTDPVAATQALDVTQADAIITQQTANRGAARDPISIAESTLQSVTTLIQDAKTAAIYAGNGSLNASDRAKLATDLGGRLQELIGLANNKDAAGNYLFAGFQSGAAPFVETAAGVGYFGDNGQRLMQVSAGRQIATSDNGADVFMRIKNGNGVFVTQANTVPANTGTGVINAGTVTNPAALTGNNYSVNFTMPAGSNTGMTYTVTNVTTGLPVTGQVAQPYVSGQAIAFDGLQVAVQGVPNSGDSFTVAPSSNVSLFKTMSDLVTALNAPVVGGSLTNSLNIGINNLDNALSNILNVRATLGLRLNEIDALQATGENMSLQLKQSLSALQDTNVTQAISDLTLQQTTLQAAQKSFVQVSNLSLFTYL
jgi:flagellar hook-associated protein 3 FlgL